MARGVTPGRERRGVMPPVQITLPDQPARPLVGGVLEALMRTWDKCGWDPSDLASFRMGPDDDTDDDDVDDDTDDDDVDDDTDDDDDDTDTDDDDDDKKTKADVKRLTTALDGERLQHRKTKRSLKQWRALGRDLGMTPQQVRDAVAKKSKSSDSKDEPDAEAARREADRESRRVADRRVVRSEIKRLAGELFADPEDAPRYLDLDEYEVDEDGDVEVDDIVADLKDVLKKRPHLAKKKRRPRPDTAQRKKSGGGKQFGANGAEEAARRFGKEKQTT
jgi:hypothetical protein